MPLAHRAKNTEELERGEKKILTKKEEVDGEKKEKRHRSGEKEGNSWMGPKSEGLADEKTQKKGGGRGKFGCERARKGGRRCESERKDTKGAFN